MKPRQGAPNGWVMRSVLVGVLAALSFGATACGGGSSSKSSSTSSSATASTTASTTAVAATSTSSASSSSSAADVGTGGVVTLRMAIVGDPGNPSVGVIQSFGGPKGQFVDPPKPPKDTGIYKNCSDAPKAPPPCLTVGGVNYTYGIGEFDVTVSQYVTYLNAVDPRGKNPHDLYNDDMSPTIWPKYGSIRYSSSAGTGEHYSVAYPEWADKPFNFSDFRRAVRFVNSVDNGKVLSRTQSSSGAFKYITYTVRLSRNTETGMYDVANPGTTRNRSSGFVLPSNDEWVKAAYYAPSTEGPTPTGRTRQTRSTPPTSRS